MQHGFVVIVDLPEHLETAKLERAEIVFAVGVVVIVKTIECGDQGDDLFRCAVIVLDVAQQAGGEDQLAGNARIPRRKRSFNSRIFLILSVIFRPLF